jgi:hypothetical protein
MADTKISALTAATTPVAGTEVLPIVQSSTTKQVSIANLTAGRAVGGLSWQSTSAGGSVATLLGSSLTITHAGGSTSFATFNQFPGWAGVLTITSSATEFGINSSLPFVLRNGSGSSRLSVDSTTANVTLTQGNLIQGTAAKGINFTANSAAAGMTSQLLNWYEQGTWTPTATAQTGTITAYTSSGKYVRIGRLVNVFGEIVITTAGTAAGRLNFGSLPYATDGNQYAGVARERAGTGNIYFTATDATAGATGGRIQSSTNGAIDWTGGNTYVFTFSYEV